MKNKKTIFITQAAMIAAIYVVLCLVFAPISYGAMQVRVAEGLTILPAFTPAAIPGLFIGCIISNLMGGGVVLDVVFGSIATLIGAIGTYVIGKKIVWLAPIAPILANTMIVPFVLKYGYGVHLPLIALMAFVGMGEVIGCGIFGLLLAKVLKRRVNFFKETEYCK